MTAQEARKVTNEFIQISEIDLFREINKQCKLGKRSYTTDAYLSENVLKCLKELGYEVYCWMKVNGKQMDCTFETKIFW